MSDPSFHPLTLGDTADDDGQVIDSLVQAEVTPPTPQVEPIVTPALPDPKTPTRLLSGRQLVDPTWGSPTLLLPEDTRRKFLHLSTKPVTDMTVTTVANPPAGTATWSVTVPQGETWEVLSARFTVTTSAAVSSRIPELLLVNTSGSSLTTISATTSLAASGSRTYNWYKGGGGANGSGNLGMPLPENFYLPAGYSVQGFVFGFDAADTITNIILSVRKGTTDGVTVRSDTGSSIGLGVLANGDSMDLANHTGAVIVQATGTSAVYVNYWSVTE